MSGSPFTFLLFGPTSRSEVHSPPWCSGTSAPHDYDCVSLQTPSFFFSSPPSFYYRAGCPPSFSLAVSGRNGGLSLGFRSMCDVTFLSVSSLGNGVCFLFYVLFRPRSALATLFARVFSFEFPSRADLWLSLSVPASFGPVTYPRFFNLQLLRFKGVPLLLLFLFC